MIKTGKYLILLCLIIQTSLLFSATKDTVLFHKEQTNTHILDNVDSLLNLWYVKNLNKLHPEDKLVIVPDLTIIDFPDSVYVDRIQRMNSPMDFSYNAEVKSFIDLYAKRRRNLVGVMLGLSDYYFPLFETALDAYNLPLELKYLPVIESALNPRAVSKAGATGIWQFMLVTGKQLNLRINSFVDERRDPVKSTYAAAKYLKQLYSIYGDWMLAIAAYNCGPGNVNKAIKRANGKMNYWQVYNYLPKETRGYIPAFIAANYVMTYYHEHNIVPQRIEMFQTDTIMVNNNLHLEQVSKVLGIDMNLLRDLNPQYKKDILPAKNDLYTLTIPANFVNKYVELKDSVFRYKDSIFFNPKKIFYKPADFGTADYAMLSKVSYTVKPGDNIKLVAKWFNVDATDIIQWNKIKKGIVKNGQKLIVNVPKDKAEEYKKLNNMSFDSKQLFANTHNNANNKLTAFQNKKTNTADTKDQNLKNKEINELKRVLESIDSPKTLDSVTANVNTKTDSSCVNKDNIQNSTKLVEMSNSEIEHDYMYYTVKSGDTIWSIAKSFSEVTYDIMQLNNLSDADLLSPGQKLKIKKKK